jgi:hypothetical protein
MDNDDASTAFCYEVAADKMRNQLKFLLSKLVCTISTESHPIAFLFEDLHWADNDAFGNNYLTDILFYHLIHLTFTNFSTETMQTIMMDRSNTHCMYFVRFRDDDAPVTLGITQVIEAVQDQGLQLFNIRLGPVDKDTINTLVSETLVSSRVSYFLLLLRERSPTVIPLNVDHTTKSQQAIELLNSQQDWRSNSLRYKPSQVAS